MGIIVLPMILLNILEKLVLNNNYKITYKAFKYTKKLKLLIMNESYKINITDLPNLIVQTNN